MNDPASTNQDSERAREHDRMLEEALARPGVREFIRVYENWRMRDRALDPYRAMTRRRGRIIISDRVNP